MSSGGAVLRARASGRGGGGAPLAESAVAQSRCMAPSSAGTDGMATRVLGRCPCGGEGETVAVVSSAGSRRAPDGADCGGVATAAALGPWGPRRAGGAAVAVVSSAGSRRAPSGAGAAGSRLASRLFNSVRRAFAS